MRRRWEHARASEDFAWACLITNVFGVPGVGTLMAGRWEGVAQLVLSLAGGVLLTWWLVRMAVGVWGAEVSSPLEAAPLHLAAWGGGLFAAGWVWALVSGALVLRAARSRRPPAIDSSSGGTAPSRAT
ncbi:MAG TPA: hypothetical protein VMR21_14240 [Vicinamibacteria bacterium]|nr:hypothetical protein [Vicinamibacteria bacterium]